MTKFIAGYLQERKSSNFIELTPTLIGPSMIFNKNNIISVIGACDPEEEFGYNARIEYLSGNTVESIVVNETYEEIRELLLK